MLLSGQINFASKEPLYHQLKEIIRKNILLGVFNSNDKIPTEEELSKTFKVSKSVVRQAVSLLVQEGFLIKRQGKGTFVADFRITQGPRKLTSFTQEMQLKGLEPKTVLLEKRIIKANKKIADAFSIQIGTPVIMVKRIRFANNEPIGIQTFYTLEKLVPNFFENPLTQSLYNLLESKYGLKIVKADEKYYATILDKHESKLLKVKEPFAGFIVERIAYDISDIPVEYTESIIRADKYSVEIILRK